MASRRISGILRKERQKLYGGLGKRNRNHSRIILGQLRSCYSCLRAVVVRFIELFKAYGTLICAAYVFWRYKVMNTHNKIKSIPPKDDTYVQI